MKRFLSVLAISVTLCACSDLQEMTMSPAEKINAAFPPEVEIQVAEERLRKLLEEDQAALQRLDSQYASRMELRALNCARDLEVGRFDRLSSVRALPVDRECLSEQDEDIKRFLGIRLISHLLAQPPLRPPAAAESGVAFSDGPEFSPYTAEAASAAGVAVVSGTRQQYVSVDMQSGRKIADLGTHSDAHHMAISPNGRVLVLTIGGHEALFLDTETGARLWRSQDINRVLAWLPDLAAALATATKGGVLTIVDFQNGSLVPHEPGLSHQTWAVPIGSSTTRLAVGSPHEYAVLDYARAPGGIVANVQQSRRFSQGRGVTSSWPASVFDGEALVFVSIRDLMMVDLASGEETFWKTGEFLSNRFAKIDETTLLVDAHSGKGIGSTPRLFDLEAETLAPVDERLHANGLLIGFTHRAGYARRSHSKVWFGKVVAAGQPESLARILDAFHLERQLARLQAASRVETAVDMTGTFPGMPRPAPAPPAQEPSRPDPYLLKLASGARIEAVGVYQGVGAGKGRGAAARSPGRVMVRIRKSSKPLVLSLSSYEPVRWVLMRESGARLQAVLVSGHSTSDVFGADSARVLDVGTAYAYSRESSEYRELNANIKRQAGKGIDVFQGRYEGKSFEVGG